MKRILVAMDLSPLSDRAFERTLQLAQKHDADMTVAHIVDEQMLGYGDENSDLAAVFAQRAEDKLKRHWPALSTHLVQRVRLAIKIGSPWVEILDLAKAEASDLIVLGLHRIHPLKDAFIGSTAERIIRHSTVPVLVVKDKPLGAYRKVMATTDFLPSSSRALQTALNLVPDANFQLLHVFETPFPAFIRFSDEELKEYRQERIDEASKQVLNDLNVFMRSHLTEAKPNISTLIERGDVVSGIASIVEKQQPDLLVLGTHRSSGILGALLGSVAMSFLNDPPCDVLISH